MADQEFEDAFHSNANAEKTADEPLIRVMALHGLAFCGRFFYLEEMALCWVRAAGDRFRCHRDGP